MKFLLAARVLFGTQSDLLIELALKFRKFKKKEKKTTSQKIAKKDCFLNTFLVTVCFYSGVKIC